MNVPMEILIALLVAVAGTFLIVAQAVKTMISSVVSMNAELRTDAASRRIDEADRTKLVSQVTALISQIALLEISANKNTVRITELEKDNLAKERLITALQNENTELRLRVAKLEEIIVARDSEIKSLKSETAPASEV